MLGIAIRAAYPGRCGRAAGGTAALRPARDDQSHRRRDRSLPPMAGGARRLCPSLRQADGAARPKDGPCDADLAVMLSAIIITRNEARNIAACLDSVAFCDERIVVDCGSDDDTVKIAAAAGATVGTPPGTGLCAPRKFSASDATRRFGGCSDVAVRG